METYTETEQEIEADSVAMLERANEIVNNSPITHFQRLRYYQPQVVNMGNIDDLVKMDIDLNKLLEDVPEAFELSKRFGFPIVQFTDYAWDIFGTDDINDRFVPFFNYESRLDRMKQLDIIKGYYSYIS